jgi:hypothetical protein
MRYVRVLLALPLLPALVALSLQLHMVEKIARTRALL